jgi:acetylornithine deacetylase/succinyl-diaminopimelate desuccinylase family protein
MPRKKERECVLSRIDENELIEMTRQLVRIPSTTGEEFEMANYLHRYLDSMDFETSLEYVEENRPNVVAKFKGVKRGPRLLLNGHMDTVPVGKGWSKDPYSEERTDTHIWGRGAADMKGGLAVMAIAMKALKDSGVNFSGEIVFVGVVGEEENQIGTRHLINSGFNADFAIVCEPTNLQVVNSHKGAINCEITVYGKGAHASTPEEGHNAIYHASRLVLALEKYAGCLIDKKHPILGSPTFVVGTVKGGQVPYMVADYCKLMIDRRLIPGETYEDTYEEIMDVLDAVNKRFPAFRVNMDMTLTTPPMETDPESPVVKTLRQNTAEVMGIDKGVHGWPAVSDGNVLVEGGIPTALFGPGDIAGMAHKPDEGVEIEQLVEATKVVALTMIDLLEPLD